MYFYSELFHGGLEQLVNYIGDLLTDQPGLVDSSPWTLLMGLALNLIITLNNNCIHSMVIDVEAGQYYRLGMYITSWFTQYIHFSCLIRDTIYIPINPLRKLRLRKRKASTQIYSAC